MAASTAWGLTSRQPIVAIVGPTATGKSDWGIGLARRFGGEIVSADSRQVYRGMDLGTGKVEGTPEPGAAVGELVPLVAGGVRHWLLDVVEPSYPFTVAEYQRLAYRVLDHVARPFLVGGTGLYVRAVLDGLVFPDAPPDESVRAMDLPLLQARLRSLDPQADVDWQNPRRVMRAVEIVQHTGQPLSAARRLSPRPMRKLVLGVDLPFEPIRERIHARLLSRLEAGMVDEVRALPVTAERLEAFGLEYRYVGRYLAGRLSYAGLVAELETAIVQYAKRQLTWFRKYGGVEWVTSYPAAEALVVNFFGVDSGSKMAAFEAPDVAQAAGDEVR